MQWGIGWGLFLGCFLVLWISVGYLTGTNAHIENRPAWAVLSAAYVLAGIVCGTVVGILKPLLTSFVKSLLLGPVIALPLFLTVYAATGEPFALWDAVDWVIFVITVVVFGTVGGGLYWQIHIWNSAGWKP